MPTNDREPQQCDWAQSVNLDEETAYVVIYPAQSHAEEWMEEANAQGRSRSKYLYELIQEARAKRQGQLSSRSFDAERVEEPEGTIDQLEAELEAARQSDAETQTVDAAPIVDPVLTTRYQPFDDIVDTAIETDDLDDWLRPLIEERLYELADEGEVEYKGGHGWRLTNGGDDV